jgi:hypothetical protein
VGYIIKNVKLLISVLFIYCCVDTTIVPLVIVIHIVTAICVFSDVFGFVHCGGKCVLNHLFF